MSSKNKISPNENYNTFSLSVRDFVSYSYRHGSIVSSSFQDNDISSTSLHSRFINSYKNKFSDLEILSEYTLKEQYPYENYIFNISGRADLIKKCNDNVYEIIEIKGLFGKQIIYPEKVDILHQAQAIVYAYMFGRENNIKEDIKITVCYVNSKDFKTKYFTSTFSFEALDEFIKQACKTFLEIFIDVSLYKQLRNKSIKNLKFPYEDLRDGQKDFMKYVLDTIKYKTSRLISAPTGIGKTISALYPAVKSIPHDFSDYIFYLTAKTSTQEVANNALLDMRKNGLILKSIQITAKEKICLQRDIFCDMNICPMAIKYYDNSKNAIKALLKFDFINAKIIQQIAKKYNVCPFEISLDISLFCDVIVCDYNYFFNPRVALDRFVNNEAYRFTVLVDEAHNLPPRANEMYSSDLTSSKILEMYNNKHYLTKITVESISNLYNYFLNLNEFFSEKENSPFIFDNSIKKDDFYKSNDTCASRKLPKYLLKLINDFLMSAREDLENLESGEFKNIFKLFYFEMKFFMRVATDFFNDSYILFIHKTRQDLLFSLKCLNSNKMISSNKSNRYGLIYFSATLKPKEYFINLLINDLEKDNCEYIELPSPFPAENLLVGTITDLSVKYNDRLSTLNEIKERVIIAISSKKGNYIVFCPSFQYMELIASELVNNIDENKNEEKMEFDIIKQSRNMNEKQRQNFLDEFNISRNKTLVAFAVLGGVFSEGIDLVGDNLTGVVIIGVGIPTRNTYQEIIKDYYSSLFGNGYNFAYRYPGFNKILQAGGRVIRSDTDKGFILLIDKRYELPEYISLFPNHWNSLNLSDKETMQIELSNFFKS